MKFNTNDTRSFGEVMDELANNWGNMSKEEQEEIISMFTNDTRSFKEVVNNLANNWSTMTADEKKAVIAAFTDRED